jgi:Major tropism determinant N-terminal domain
MAQQIQFRRGSSSAWVTANPILGSGEIGIELGTPVKVKIGDGTTAWNALPYFGGSGGTMDYNDLSNLPTLGTAAAQNVGAFATAAQGVLAGTAVQPGSLAAVATSGAYADLSGRPTIPPKKHYYPFHIQGNLAAGSGLALLPMMAPGNITGYRFKAVTAPVGGSAVLDWKINGTTAFTTTGNRPTMATGQTTTTTTLPNVTSVSAGDYVSLDCISSAGSPVAADVTGVLEITET